MSVESLDPETGAVADILGSAIEPREDPPLVREEAEYTDDIQLENTAHMAVLRSQHGHAKLGGADTTDAAPSDSASVDVGTNGDDE